MQRYGKVDVVVSNAAANPSIDPILQMKESVLDKLWEINVKSSILILKVISLEFFIVGSKNGRMPFWGKHGRSILDFYNMASVSACLFYYFLWRGTSFHQGRVQRTHPWVVNPRYTTSPTRTVHYVVQGNYWWEIKPKMSEFTAHPKPGFWPLGYTFTGTYFFVLMDTMSVVYSIWWPC